MLLAIDIGNTNIHLGLYQEGEWHQAWRARTVPDKMPDEYAALMRDFLEQVGLAFADISGVSMASVVPRLEASFNELCAAHLAHAAQVVVGAKGTAPGIRIEVDAPHEVGADRIVNAAAVHHLYKSAAIVIDFGTATTFDIVSANGAYRGGAIAPGIGLSHDALVAHTARLYKVALEPPPSPIGRNTAHAMQSGLFLGYVALIEGLVARLRASMDTPAQVIATGGLAPAFARHTSVIEHTAPLLTLEGLRIIYELNAQ